MTLDEFNALTEKVAVALDTEGYQSSSSRFRNREHARRSVYMTLEYLGLTRFSPSEINYDLEGFDSQGYDRDGFSREDSYLKNIMGESA